MTAARPKTVTDPDGAIVQIFPLPTDEASLEQLLRDLFEQHWNKITFGPLIQISPTWPSGQGVPSSGLAITSSSPAEARPQPTISLPSPPAAGTIRSGYFWLNKLKIAPLENTATPLSAAIRNKSPKRA